MPKPWYLGVGEYALLAAYYVVMGLGPPAYLLWAWRRWGSRQRLAIHAALLPVGLFVLAGGLGAALALVEVLHSPPTRTVFSMRGPWEYVAYSYWKLGAWSAWSAGLFALVWVPAVLAWRRVHPASFRRVTTPASRQPPSFAERDYGDRVIADPTAPTAAPARPTPRTDYLLWLALAGIPVLAFVGLRLVQSGGAELVDEFTSVTSWAVLVAVASVVIGWAAQEVAVRRGFRLSGRRRPKGAGCGSQGSAADPVVAPGPRRR